MKNLKLNDEESVITHNAVIFMANDLMDEIVDLENHIKDKESIGLVFPYKEEMEKDLAEKKRRWDVMVNLSKRAAGETSEVTEKLKSIGTCPECLVNPSIERIFNFSEISLKLYDAKFNGIINEDQLFKILDSFEGKAKDED